MITWYERGHRKSAELITISKNNLYTCNEVFEEIGVHVGDRVILGYDKNENAIYIAKSADNNQGLFVSRKFKNSGCTISFSGFQRKFGFSAQNRHYKWSVYNNMIRIQL